MNAPPHNYRKKSTAGEEGEPQYGEEIIEEEGEGDYYPESTNRIEEEQYYEEQQYQTTQQAFLLNTKTLKQRMLRWISEASGEKVDNWNRVSQGDVICFILNRLRPGVLDLQEITDGVDKFARVGNWRLAARVMRKLGMGWSYDEVKLVMADQKELVRLVLSIRRWETRYMNEPLEPPSPDEWNDNDIPSWFTQQTAKEIEEKRLAMGENHSKKQKQVIKQPDIRKIKKAERVPISAQMKGIFKPTPTNS